MGWGKAIRINEKGSTLVMVLGISTLVAILASALFPNVMALVRTSDNRVLKEALREIIQNYRSCVNSGPAWDYTVKADANIPLRCLATTDGCDTKMKIPISPIIKEPDADLTDLSHHCIPGYDPQDPTAGFSLLGSLCHEFKATGSPSCPIHIDINWQTECLDGLAKCPFPIETIVGAIRVAAGSAELSSIGLGEGRSPDYPDQEIFTILVGSATDRVPLLLQEKLDFGTNGGTCKKADWVPRKLNFAQTNVGDRAILLPPDYKSFKLKRGTYFCEFSVPGYMVGHYRARLKNLTKAGTTLILGSSEYSPQVDGYSQSRSRGVGQIKVEEFENELVLEQYCEDIPLLSDPTDSSAAAVLIQSLAGGVPASVNSTKEIYSNFWCLREGD